MPGDRRAFGLRIYLRNEEFSWSNWGGGIVVECGGKWDMTTRCLGNRI